MEHHSILAYRLRRDRVQTYLRDKFNDQYIEVQISGNEFVFYLERRLTEEEEEEIDELRD